MSQTPLSTPTTARRWLPRLLPVAILLLGVILFLAIMGGDDATERKRPERPARLVEVTTVAPTNEQVLLEAWGSVVPAREVTLRARVNSEVVALQAQATPGSHPEAGEPLVTLDDSDHRLAVQRAESALVRARAALDQEQGRHAVAQAEFMLAELDELSPDERRLMLREPQLEAAEAEVAAAEADREEARLNLARTRIAAPFNALVLDRHVAQGSRVGVGQDLLTLVDRDTFWVELALPARSLRWLQSDSGATVTLEHEGAWAPGENRQGRVLQVRSDVDEPGRMVRLLVAVDDPLGLNAEGRPSLLLGSHVRGLIEGRRLDGVYALRPAWLRQDDTVWVMDADDRLAIRQPELLHRGRTQVLLRGELEPGDRVVISDLGIPEAGMPLRTAEEDR